MDTLVHADIFFFVSTIALIAVSISLVVVFYYCVQILRDVKDVVHRVNTASKDVEKDFNDLRSSVKSEVQRVGAVAGMGVNALVRTFMPRAGQAKPRKPKKQKPKSDTESE